MVESTLTLKFRGVEADLLNQMVDMGLFNSKSEAIRSALIKYAMDLNLLDSKFMWNEIKSYPGRQVSAEQLAKDIRSIKDEI
jgi:Arc/MetJ-type ribon-helix-helix transcriptional regulator